MCSIFATCSTVYACSGYSPPLAVRLGCCPRPRRGPGWIAFPLFGSADRGWSRPTYGESGQAPDQASDRTRRDVAELCATRFLPDADDNDSEQDQDERYCREDD